MKYKQTDIVDAIAILKKAQTQLSKNPRHGGICHAVYVDKSGMAYRSLGRVSPLINAALEFVKPTAFVTTGIDGRQRSSESLLNEWSSNGYWWDRQDKMARLNALDRAMYWLTTLPTVRP